MQNEPSEQDFRNLAAQLRKPSGEDGEKVGKFMNDGNGPMNRHAIAVLNPENGDNILEIGMGNGFFVKNILGVHPSIQYCGCDYSDQMVSASIEQNNDFVKKGNARFVCADAKQIPFESEAFDKVFTVNTFYFWDDYDAVINEIKRVLKSGGKLILSVRPDHVMVKIPVTKYGFTIMSKEDIISFLGKHGMKNISITEIKEPSHEKWGDMATLIFDCLK